MLRTIRSKTKKDTEEEEEDDIVFVHEEDISLTKRAYEELTKEQIGKIARNVKMISHFVESNQIAIKSMETEQQNGKESDK